MGSDDCGIIRIEKGDGDVQSFWDLFSPFLK